MVMAKGLFDDRGVDLAYNGGGLGLPVLSKVEGLVEPLVVSLS
jgi:hypothetical protein